MLSSNNMRHNNGAGRVNKREVNEINGQNSMTLMTVGMELVLNGWTFFKGGFVLEEKKISDAP